MTSSEVWALVLGMVTADLVIAHQARWHQMSWRHISNSIIICNVVGLLFIALIALMAMMAIKGN